MYSPNEDKTEYNIPQTDIERYEKSYTTENKAIRWKMAISRLLHYSAAPPHQKTQGQTYPHPRKGSYGL